MGQSITEPKEEIMKTLHAAFLSQRSPQSVQALRTRMLILPLAASIYCMGLAADLRAQPVQYIEQGQAQAAFTQQELDQMLAPIALYPDSLLSQILMASTYPLEVVQAARWSRAHPGLSGDDAVRAVASQDWDPSVKSMLAFPQILSMMDERLDWTQRLGDAFLDQEPHVMETVQTLRQRAYAAGNLNSDTQVRVVRQVRVILVEPVNPQLVYVPYYDPTVIYGAWWWPAPPVYWRPWAGYAPARVRPGVSVGLYWGSGVRISLGFFFGRPDWQRRSVNVVHVNNYYYNNAVVVNRSGPAHPQAGPGPWRHDPSRRGSIPYRDPAVRQQFAGQQRQAVEQRRDDARREPQAEIRRGPEVRDDRDGRGRDGRADDGNRNRDGDDRNNRGDGRRDGRGDARPDRGTGARSDAVPAAIQPAQRPDQAQVQQLRQAEQAQRQQQQAQRQAEQAQRQQQQAQQRQQQEARRDEPRKDARPAGAQREDRGEGRGRGEGRNRQSAS